MCNISQRSLYYTLDERRMNVNRIGNWNCDGKIIREMGSWSRKNGLISPEPPFDINLFVWNHVLSTGKPRCHMWQQNRHQDNFRVSVTKSWHDTIEYLHHKGFPDSKNSRIDSKDSRMSIKYRPNAKVSDRYLIDVDLRILCYLGWCNQLGGGFYSRGERWTRSKSKFKHKGELKLDDNCTVRIQIVLVTNSEKISAIDAVLQPPFLLLTLPVLKPEYCRGFYYDVDEIFWPQPIRSLKIGSCDRSRIHVLDLGGTDVWPGKNGFHKKCKNLDNIAVYLIASLKSKWKKINK